MKKQLCFCLLAFVFFLSSCNNGNQEQPIVVDADVKSITIMTHNTIQGYSKANPVNGQKIYPSLILTTTAKSWDVLSEITYSSYLSTDDTLSSGDVLLTGEGKTEPSSYTYKDNGWSLIVEESIPVDTAPGDYHYLFVRTIDGKRNVTSSQTFTVDKITSLGAFKVYNSWGKSWDDNISDGYYYLPFEKAMQIGMLSFLSSNDRTEKYEPMLVAQFKIDATGNMQDYETYFTISKEGESDALASKPFLVKTIKQESTLPYVPFDSAKTYTYDLTDFIDALPDDYTGDYDVTLHVDPVGSGAAKITYFTLYFYNNDTVSYQTETNEVLTNTEKMTEAGHDTNELTISGIADLSTKCPKSNIIVRGISEGDMAYTVHEMTDAEKRELNDRFVDKPTVIDGHGTGWVKAQELSVYDGMDVIEALGDAGDSSKGVTLSITPEKVDNSDDKRYFPPAGNQGDTGSCVAFSEAYYSLTHEMAIEQKWDLTDVTFNDDKNAEQTTWGPSDTTHIISPAFLYNQANGGESGMVYVDALSFLANMGCCTWNNMGSDAMYSTVEPDSGKVAYPQPEAVAFFEALKYRLSDSYALSGETYSLGSVLKLNNMANIKLAVEFIKKGYCLTMAVPSKCLYGLFNKNSVLVGAFPSGQSTDHAQTIVGYVTGEEYEKLLTGK